MIEEHDQPGALDVQKAKGKFNILKQVLNVCARRASTAKNVKLSWSLSDLPKEFFYKCKIPDEYGVIKGDFSICGNTICTHKFRFETLNKIRT